jgi:hypothetical protein
MKCPDGESATPIFHFHIAIFILTYNSIIIRVSLTFPVSFITFVSARYDAGYMTAIGNTKTLNMNESKQNTYHPKDCMLRTYLNGIQFLPKVIL